MDMNASVPAGTFINEHTPALMTTIMRNTLMLMLMNGRKAESLEDLFNINTQRLTSLLGLYLKLNFYS